MQNTNDNERERSRLAGKETHFVYSLPTQNLQACARVNETNDCAEKLENELDFETFSFVRDAGRRSRNQRNRSQFKEGFQRLQAQYCEVHQEMSHGGDKANASERTNDGMVSVKARVLAMKRE